MFRDVMGDREFAPPHQGGTRLRVNRATRDISQDSSGLSVDEEEIQRRKTHDRTQTPSTDDLTSVIRQSASTDSMESAASVDSGVARFREPIIEEDDNDLTVEDVMTSFIHADASQGAGRYETVATSLVASPDDSPLVSPRTLSRRGSLQVAASDSTDADYLGITSPSRRSTFTNFNLSPATSPSSAKSKGGSKPNLQRRRSARNVVGVDANNSELSRPGSSKKKDQIRSFALVGYSDDASTEVQPAESHSPWGGRPGSTFSPVRSGYNAPSAIIPPLKIAPTLQLNRRSKRMTSPRLPSSSSNDFDELSPRLATGTSDTDSQPQRRSPRSRAALISITPTPSSTADTSNTSGVSPRRVTLSPRRRRMTSNDETESINDDSAAVMESSEPSESSARGNGEERHGRFQIRHGSGSSDREENTGDESAKGDASTRSTSIRGVSVATPTGSHPTTNGGPEVLNEPSESKQGESERKVDMTPSHPSSSPLSKPVPAPVGAGVSPRAFKTFCEYLRSDICRNREFRRSDSRSQIQEDGVATSVASERFWNALPVSACLTARCLVHWDVFHPRRSDVLSDLINSLHSNVHEISENIDDLCFCLSWVALMHHFVSSLSNEHYKDEAIEWRSRALNQFSKDLTMLYRRIFRSLQMKFLEIPAAVNIGKLLETPVEEMAVHPQVDIILDCYSVNMQVLDRNHVPPSIKSLSLEHWLYHLNCVVFNHLFSESSLKLSPTLGLKLQIICSRIAQWSQDKGGSQGGNTLRTLSNEKLAHVLNVSHILLVDKSQVKAPDELSELCTALSPVQLVRLLDNYESSEASCADKLKEEVFDRLRGRAAIYSDSTVLLDPNRQSRVDFSHLKYGMFDLSIVPISDRFADDSEFAFLLDSESILAL